MCSVILYYTLIFATGQNVLDQFNLPDKEIAEIVIEVYKDPEVIKRVFAPKGIVAVKDFEITEHKPFDCKKGPK